MCINAKFMNLHFYFQTHLLIERNSVQAVLRYHIMQVQYMSFTHAAQWANYIFRHFPLQFILMTQPYVTCMYYVTSSFIVSTKGKMVHVVDLYNLVLINPSLFCLSVSTFSITFSKINLIFMAQIIFESIHRWVKETYHLK